MEDLLTHIESRLRRIIREEVTNAIVSSGQNLGDQTIKSGRSRLLTATEVADMLQLSIQRVYSLARRSETNGFPVLRIGERTMRFQKEEILEWIKKDES